MKTVRGPGIFLAQFAGDKAPFDSLANMGRWAAGLGYVGVQIPTWDQRLFDLARAAESQTYCDEIQGQVEGTRYLHHRVVDPPAGSDGRRSSRLRSAHGRLCSRGCARQSVSANRVGNRAIEARRQGVAPAGVAGPCHVQRRPGVALLLPLASAAGGADRNCIR